MVSSKGMRRVVYADGALHLLLGEDKGVIQVRTPNLNSEVDCVGASCKVGVEVRLEELFLFAVEILAACALKMAAEAAALAGSSASEEVKGV